MNRKDWSEEELIKIWTSKNGNANEAKCPFSECPNKNVLMRFSNYGNHSEVSWVVDHIIAIDNGGKNELSNLRPLHNLCNSIKSNRMIK
ncbi:HNH endonuclease [Spiroplasma turonicum]|uniref:HNH nuclease domain-containing protein n=1 Tax=Spiroplasma turonicum TaxID=216946 RepID=A0A0K1P699_9MOLU|nr:HNH endonuclease signature motif containing protein [Spiroplasma turonicum]AKU79831.1 hypothetical protein STURON_00585 [Spiroplasma turonicum]ALX70846.1 hypothetical protein STURO_v1c05800 [Spiroplasma turonicum]